MNGDWLGIGGFLLAAFTLVYSMSKDSKKWIMELFNTHTTAISDIKAENKAYAEQQASLLRDHYMPLRDFARHEQDQKETITELKSRLDGIDDKLDDMPDKVANRLKKNG